MMKKTSSSRSDVPILDREDALKRLQNDREFLNVLYGAFIEDLPNKFNALDEAIAGRELKSAQQAAHSLKGAAATVGAASLREAALEMEMAARDGDADKIKTLCPGLRAAAEQTLREMTKVLKGA